MAGFLHPWTTDGGACAIILGNPPFQATDSLRGFFLPLSLFRPLFAARQGFAFAARQGFTFAARQCIAFAPAWPAKNSYFGTNNIVNIYY